MSRALPPLSSRLVRISQHLGKKPVMATRKISRKSYLDLARGVDAFPYQQYEPEAYESFARLYYKFKIGGFSQSFGLLPAKAVDVFKWPECWVVDHSSRTLTLSQGKDANQRSEFFGETLELMVKSGKIPTLKKLRKEMVPTYKASGELVLNIDRAACILFGTVAHGVQMLAYTQTSQGLKYWVPRRAQSRESYPGMLDTCVGGALNSGESPLDCLVREAGEEASLPEDYVRANAKPYSVLSYHMNTDGNGNEGHQPEVQYVYHIKLSPEVVPTPLDGEVEKFEQMSLDEVQDALVNGEFKTNCSSTWLAYLIMLGKINAENEKDLLTISCHLHRRLDFLIR
ncbi:thiamine pyrophosphokinase [Glonium stellatum]|uniref:Thiamine pyrophosphokinase n=1 Tax=Glonium stellatum TaxID=574774 RepID=A0A8E2EVH4_9PEZI|nr:thiamine pyrophosphokinase [Glonium stellatum]